jgi:predicted transcriptional regulator
MVPGDAASFAKDAYAPGRWSILKALALEPLRYTDLAGDVNVSEGEVTRNLRVLAEAHLVSKGSDNRFALTPLGRAAVQAGRALDVLGRHGPILATLALERLAPSAASDVACLAHARLVTDPFDMMRGVDQLFDGVRTEFLASWIIGREALDPEARERQARLAKRLNAGVDARGILWEQERRTMAESPMRGRMQIRWSASPPLNLIVTDAGAWLNLPDAKGAPQFTHAFFGDHPAFTAWVRGIFEAEWQLLADAPSEERVPAAARA